MEVFIKCRHIKAIKIALEILVFMVFLYSLETRIISIKNTKVGYESLAYGARGQYGESVKR